MSLILDALKKAERQHKLGEVPGIGAQPGGATPSSLRGLGWLMLILFACLMLGIGLYLGGFRLVPAVNPPAQQPAPVAAPPLAVAPQAPIEPVTPQPPVETPPPVVQSAAEPPPLPKPAPAPARPPKPLSEMPAGFVANLPPLNIDIHSYDQRPAKRYVLINMEKYREGDYLAEGPQLIEILPDGAVLEHLGERFILPIGNQ